MVGITVLKIVLRSGEKPFVSTNEQGYNRQRNVWKGMILGWKALQTGPCDWISNYPIARKACCYVRNKKNSYNFYSMPPLHKNVWERERIREFKMRESPK